MFDTEVVDAFESAVQGFVSDDVKRIADEDLERGIVTMQRVIDRLQVERLRMVAEVNRRRSFARDGFVSASTWLADRNRTTFAQAKRDVALAQALEEMPTTRAALEQGHVSAAAANILVQARETVTGEFERNEAKLVQAARILPVGELRAKVAEWVQKVDEDAGGEQAERRYERRRLDVFPSTGGMVRMDGELDPETGSPVMTAIRVVIDVDLQRRDMRTPAQRRADAIAEICRRYLAGNGRPVGETDRPDVTVIADIRATGGGRR